jgi:threonine/homoserine/homoserine lactone efflux protein
MFLQALGEMLPAALAVALSPFPIIAVVLVLGTSAAVRNGLSFAGGWLLGLGLLTALVLVLVGGGDDDPGASAHTLLSWLRVAIGLALLFLAGRKWHTRPRHGDEPVMPTWMAGIESVSAARAFRLGALLGGANPKNIALTLSGTASIAELTASGGSAWWAATAFVLISSSTVMGTVVVRFVMGERAAAPLNSVSRFMSDNNAVIMMVVLLVLGAKILGDGLAGLGA